MEVPPDPHFRHDRTDHSLRSTGLLRVALVVIAVATAAITLRYTKMGPRGVELLASLDGVFAWLGRDTRGFFAAFVESQEPKYQAQRVPLLVHIVGMSLALAIGAAQLVPGIRRRWVTVHRGLGLVYTLCALVGFSLGAVLAVTLPMVGGRWAIFWNVLAGVLGVSFTVNGARLALSRRFTEHGRWMTRSYAVAATLLTLYGLVFVFVLAGVPARIAYEAGHVLCLPLNLMIAEGVLFARRRLPLGLSKG